MSTARRTWCWWHIVLLLTIGAGVLPNESRAADVSGVYADKGPVVGTDPTKPPQEVSLHALLNLEFDPAIGLTRYEQTALLKLIDDGTAFEVRSHDHEGELLWRGRWRQGEGGFSRDGQRVVLRLRAPRHGDVVFAFFLQPLPDTDLLEVKVLRISPTAFGPGARTLGTYFFHRVPEPDNLAEERRGDRLDVTW